MVKIIPRTFTREEDDFRVAEDPRTWLAHFEKVCRPNGWDNDNAKATNFIVFLEGEADDWYQVNQVWIEDNTRTWAQIKTAFIGRFQPANYEDEVEERLCMPTQKIGESVRAYSARYEKLH